MDQSVLQTKNKLVWLVSRIRQFRGLCPLISNSLETTPSWPKTNRFLSQVRYFGCSWHWIDALRDALDERRLRLNELTFPQDEGIIREARGGTSEGQAVLWWSTWGSYESAWTVWEWERDAQWQDREQQKERNWLASSDRAAGIRYGHHEKERLFGQQLWQGDVEHAGAAVGPRLWDRPDAQWKHADEAWDGQSQLGDWQVTLESWVSRAGSHAEGLGEGHDAATNKRA